MLNEKQQEARATLGTTDEINKSVMDHIHYVTDRMIGTSGLVDADRQDLIQIFTMAVLKAKKNFRPDSKNPTGTAFFNRVIDCKANDIYRSRSARGLDRQSCLVEDMERHVPEDGPAPDELLAEADRGQLISDVHTVIDRLPENLKRMCQLHLEGMSFERMAPILGVRAVTLRTRWLPKLREIFRQEGF
jgi:RNA polymerase sigma factor (sigma-70 family)